MKKEAIRPVLSTIFVSITSTVAAAGIVAILVLLRTMSGDVRVNASVMENYIAVEAERHATFSKTISANSRRVQSVEFAIQYIQTRQGFWHGTDIK